jgi:hypothetical protein
MQSGERLKYDTASKYMITEDKDNVKASDTVVNLTWDNYYDTVEIEQN